MKVVFMGTPDFSVPALSSLHEAGFEIPLVVTKPDTPRDRGKKLQASPVKEKALELGLAVCTPEKIKNNEEFAQTLEAIAPDFIAVVAYGKILPKRILDIPKYGCINVHASLLPKYRGAAPVHRAVIEGEEETGVTIMFMAEGMDTGDICLQEKTPVERKTTEDLWEELSAMGGRLLVQALPMIADGSAPRIPQDDSLASLAPMLFKEDGVVDFSKNMREIDCLVRGFYSWPMASTVYNGQVMKLHGLIPGRSGSFGAPGTVIAADKKGIEVVCGDGSVIITRLQLPGKKAMDVSSFLLGNRIEPGTVLG